MADYWCEACDEGHMDGHESLEHFHLVGVEHPANECMLCDSCWMQGCQKAGITVLNIDGTLEKLCEDHEFELRESVR